MLNHTALVVIDLQNDYFPQGAFPLWESEAVRDRIITLIKAVAEQGGEIVLIQHIADPARTAPFFNHNTWGVEIEAQIRAAAPDAPIIVKHFADSFEQTALADFLASKQIQQVLLCGMMTQNCITHTALSKEAEKYTVTVVNDCCTTVSEILHLIALKALSTRTQQVNAEQVIKGAL